MLPWSQYQIILTIARKKRLSQAAQVLGVNETTIARQLQKAEISLGESLFMRSPQGWLPTGFGEMVIRAAEAMEQAAFTLEEQAGLEEGPISGTVRITALTFIIEYIIAPHIDQLTRAHPDLHIEVMGTDVSVDLSQREADIALRLARPKTGRLAIRKIGDIHFSAYRDQQTRQKGIPERWIGYERRLDHLPEMEAGRRAFSGEPYLRFSSLNAVRGSVAQGLGGAILPDCVAANDPALAHLPVPGASASRELWMLVHEDLRRMTRLRVVMDWISETTASVLAQCRPEQPRLP